MPVAALPSLSAARLSAYTVSGPGCFALYSRVSGEEKRVWREVVNAMHARWFESAEVQVLLARYCFVAMIVRRPEEAMRGPIREPDSLDKLSALMLARSLRLTPSSTRSA
jgi:hypothetical protein